MLAHIKIYSARLILSACTRVYHPKKVILWASNRIGKSPQCTRLPKKANWENRHTSSIVHKLFYARFARYGNFCAHNNDKADYVTPCACVRDDRFLYQRMYRTLATKAPWAGAPYIGSELGGGPIFQCCSYVKEHTGKLPTWASQFK